MKKYKYTLLFLILLFTKVLISQEKPLILFAEIDTSDIVNRIKTENAEQILQDNAAKIKSRLEKFGIARVDVRSAENNRLRIEIPFTKEEEKIKALIETCGNLSFHLVTEKEDVKKVTEKIDTELNRVEPGLVENQFTALIDQKIASGMSGLYFNIKLKRGVEMMLIKDFVRRVYEDSIMFAWSERAIKTRDDDYLVLYFLSKEKVIDGSMVKEADYYLDSAYNTPYTSIILNAEGTGLWERFTGENTGKDCAIVFDGKVFSTPRIMQKISGGKIHITGLASLGDAKLLPIILNSGTLSAPMRVVKE